MTYEVGTRGSVRGPSSTVRGLYAIVDLDALAERGLDPLDFAERVLAARPAALQLRSKRATPRATVVALRQLREPARRAGVLYFANDRPDLALLAECDGVHVGQDDLPAALVRRYAPRLAVGVSTHDVDQLDRALSDRPDYVAFGPVFLTLSKEHPDPVVGLERLAAARERCDAHGTPLVAIGGITHARAPLVAQHATAGAAIGALLPDEGETLDGVEARTRALHVALGGA